MWNRGRRLHQFTVQKPFCTPARGLVLTALNPYGVPIHGYRESLRVVSLRNAAKLLGVELRTFENLRYGMLLPLAIQARFSVPSAQAAWAEGLLWSTGRLVVTGGSFGSLADWGKRRGGRMPKPWNARGSWQYSQTRQGTLQPPPDGQPWIEEGCHEGKEVWRAVLRAAERNG